MKLITDDGREISIERIQVVSIKPNDVVILKMKQILEKIACDSIKKGIKGIFPTNDVLILDGGVELEIKKRAEIDDEVIISNVDLNIKANKIIKG